MINTIPILRQFKRKKFKIIIINCKSLEEIILYMKILNFRNQKSDMTSK